MRASWHDRTVRAVDEPSARRARSGRCAPTTCRPPSGSAPRASTSSTCASSARSLARPGAPPAEPRRAAGSPAPRHLLGTDPGGCWVAEDATAGCSASPRRSTARSCGAWRRTPCGPGLQGRGIGKALLAAALHHGRGLACAGCSSSSSDPKAVRRYRLAGLLAAPADVPDAATVDRVRDPGRREGPRGHRRRHRPDGLASTGATRGAAHGPDHELMLRLLAAAGLRHDHRVGLRLPRRRRAGRAARRHQPAYGDPAAVGGARRRRRRGGRSRHVTAANEWAIDVGLAARLELHQRATSALRGMAPPAPYLHHGALL